MKSIKSPEINREEESQSQLFSQSEQVAVVTETVYQQFSSYFIQTDFILNYCNKISQSDLFLIVNNIPAGSSICVMLIPHSSV